MTLTQRRAPSILERRGHRLAPRRHRPVDPLAGGLEAFFTRKRTAPESSAGERTAITLSSRALPIALAAALIAASLGSQAPAVAQQPSSSLRPTPTVPRPISPDRKSTRLNSSH